MLHLKEAIPGLQLMPKAILLSMFLINNAVLVISFIGYQEKEVVVGDNKEINIKMVPVNETMNEVVVVGYGTQKKGIRYGGRINYQRATRLHRSLLLI